MNDRHATATPTARSGTSPKGPLRSIAETVLTTEGGRAPTDAEITPYWRALVDANREALLPEVTADIVTGRYVDPRAGRIELGAFADRWLAAQTFDAPTRGVSISAVAEHLGHHDPGFTLRTYAHLMRGRGPLACRDRRCLRPCGLCADRRSHAVAASQVRALSVAHPPM